MVVVLGLLAVAAVPFGGLAGVARRMAAATGRPPADVATGVGSPDA
jgi:hypothetical protein